MSMSIARNKSMSMSMSMCTSMSISMSTNMCTGMSMSIIYINTVERERVSSHLANISAGVEWPFVLLLLIAVVVTVFVAARCCLLLLLVLSVEGIVTCSSTGHLAQCGAHTNPKRRC